MTTKEILMFTIKYFNRDLIAKGRKAKFVEARYVYYHYARLYSSDRPSLSEIGDVCGGRTHATVLNGLKKFSYWQETDKKFVDMVNHFHQALDVAGGIIDPNDQDEAYTLKKKIEILKEENEHILSKFNLAETNNYVEEVASLQELIKQISDDHKIERDRLTKDNTLLKKENAELKQKLDEKSNLLTNYVLNNKKRVSFIANDTGNAI